MKFFSECRTLDELKAAYRKAAMKYHPDRGGDTETMQKVNAEYEAMFERLKREQNTRAAQDATGKTKATTETAADFIEIISKLLSMDGLIVELCGRWLWISGNTMRHKEALKAAGCKWASKKKMWSWHYLEDGAFRSRKPISMDAIRFKYGSTAFEAREPDDQYRCIATA